jgi:hypothetical protein
MNNIDSFVFDYNIDLSINFMNNYNSSCAFQHWSSLIVRYGYKKRCKWESAMLPRSWTRALKKFINLHKFELNDQFVNRIINISHIFLKLYFLLEKIQKNAIYEGWKGCFRTNFISQILWLVLTHMIY